MDFVLLAEGNLKMTAYLAGHFLVLADTAQGAPDRNVRRRSKCVDGSTPGYYDWANMSDVLAPCRP